MVVVDRVQHQVLVVPTECGVLHADVHPRDVDTRDVLDTWELKQGVFQMLHVREIPWVRFIILLLFT